MKSLLNLMNSNYFLDSSPDPSRHVTVRGRAGFSRRAFRGWAWSSLAACGLAAVLGTTRMQAGAPSVLGTTPENGGEFSDSLVVVFSTDMGEPIAITFSAGEWDCHWELPLPSLPRMILKCVPTGNLPPGTITYTLNPDGTGFVSKTGEVLPTTTGSFVVPANGGEELEVTPSPLDGGSYCPADGPVTFTFNQPMEETALVQITPGTWNYGWSTDSGAENPVFACTPTEALVPGTTYEWMLADFKSETGKLLPLTSGSFTVPEDCDGNGGGGGDKAPPCPSDPSAAPLPKTLKMCGDFGVWDMASAVGLDDGGFLIAGSYVELGDRFDTLARLNAQGMTQWQVAATDPLTDLTLGVNAQQVLATRNNEAVSQLDLALFDASTLTPRFRKRLTQTAAAPEVSQRLDGQIAVLQTFDDHLELALFTPSGTLAWARRYDCPDFIVPDGGGFPGMRNKSTCYLEMLDDGMALAFNKTEIAFDGTNVQFNQTFIWVRLGNDGAVRWAKKYADIDSISAPVAWSADDGSFLLSILGGDMSDPEHFTFDTRIIKLDAAGNVVWGRLFPHLNLHVNRVLPSGQIMLSGGLATQGVETETTDAVLLLLDASGRPVAQTRLDVAASDFAYLIRSTDDHFYFNFLAYNAAQLGLAGVGTQATEDTEAIYVGRSDLQLKHFQWRKYHEPASWGGLFPTWQEAPLVFSSFSDDTHELSLFTVNDDLTPNANCPVFTTGAPAEKTFDLTSSEVSLSSSVASVTTRAITPVVSEGDITLQRYTWIEGNLCDGPAPVLPATVGIQAGENGVTVHFDTVVGQRYTLQKSPRLKSATWEDVATVEGTGDPVSRTFPAADHTAFFRVLTTRN